MKVNVTFKEGLLRLQKKTEGRKRLGVLTSEGEWKLNESLYQRRIYRVFRNLWLVPLRELIVRLKIMKKKNI